MPEITPRVGIKKPLGNENNTRANMNENWDIIERKVATVDNSGKIPYNQLPFLDYIPNNQKGITNGVATLDVTGKVPIGQVPDLGIIPIQQRGNPNGVATLDSTGNVPLNQLTHVTSQIDRLGYDIYNLYQEQYYTGNSPIAPSKGSAKAITFDTISSTGTYNNASTVSFLNQNQGITCSLGNHTTMRPSGAVYSNFQPVNSNPFTTTPSPTGNPSDMFDGVNQSQYGWQIGTPPYNNDAWAPVRLDMGSQRVITGIQWYAAKNDVNGGGVSLFSDSGVFLVSGSSSYNNPTTIQNADMSLSEILNYGRTRYIRPAIYSGERDGQLSYHYIMEMYVKTASLLASTYRSNPIQPLPFTPTRAKMYVSRRLESGSSITPKLLCGSTLVTGTITDTRVDPLFPSYDEVEYTFNLSNMQKPTEVRIDLTPNGINVPFVKRYGIYFS